MRGVRRLSALGATAGLGVSLALLPVIPAHAAITVPCGDVARLRSAIVAANTTGESITLFPGCTYTIKDRFQSTTQNGLPSITGNVTISGSGSTITRSTATGTPTFRIFDVQPNGHLTLNSINVSGGSVTGESGGGVRLTGSGNTLDVRSGAVRNNSADRGGGVSNEGSGSVQLDYATVSGNKAATTGGGISSAGVLRLSLATVQNNTSGTDGGGIDTTAGQASLVYSQITGNHAGGQGGGIFETPGSQVSLVLTTVTGNTPNQCRPAGAVPGCVN